MLPPYSRIDYAIREMERDLAISKQADTVVSDYEQTFTKACTTVTELARETLAIWEPEYNTLRLEEGPDAAADTLRIAVEALESFIRRCTAALTRYRRESTTMRVRYRKIMFDTKECSRRAKREIMLKTKQAEERVSAMVQAAQDQSNATLYYLRDVLSEAREAYNALHSRVDRLAFVALTEEPRDLLPAIHYRLVHGGKIRVPYADFERMLYEGHGRLTFHGKQNELAYVLLVLHRNGFADNWKSLTLFYERNGIPVSVTAKNIVEAQKKLSTRNEPTVKPLLAPLKATFPALVLP